jgi:hypothetical protein
VVEQRRVTEGKRRLVKRDEGHAGLGVRLTIGTANLLHIRCRHTNGNSGTNDQSSSYRSCP